MAAGSPKTMNTLTLLQDHGWRFALILGFLAVTMRSSPTTTPGCIGYILTALILLNWLRMEITIIMHRKKLPPGNLGHLFLGDLIPSMLDSVRLALRNKKQFGNTYSVHTRSLGVTFGNTEDITWLWNSERKGQASVLWPPTIQALLGKGAVPNTTGKRHRALRRLLEPAFAPNATRDYVHDIDETIQHCLKEWSSQTNDEDEFLPSEEFKMFALRLFFVAGFGQVPMDVIQQLHDDYTTWIQGFGCLAAFRIPGTQFAKSMNARDRILSVIEQLILEFKRDNPPDSERGQKSLMGRVCYGTDESGQPMDMEDLKDNILTMVFAGHDTTYASMGTILHYLQEQQEIQKSLREEVQAFQEPLDFDQLRDAPILNAFLAEMWRMDPPVPGAFREVSKPLEYKGYAIPKGLVLIYNIILATQNEDVYQEPSRFEIGRFLPEGHALTNNSASLKAEGVDFNNMKANYPVFGGGAHACLGSHFAKLELRVLVTRMVQLYDLKVQGSEKVYFPVNGWKNKFKLTPLSP